MAGWVISDDQSKSSAKQPLWKRRRWGRGPLWGFLVYFRVKTKVSTLTQLSTLLTTLTKPLIVKKMWTKFFRIPRCSNDNCRFQGNFIAVFCLDCFIKRQKCSYLKVDFKIPPSTTQMSTPASHGLVGWWTRTRFLKSKQNKVKSRKKDWVWNWSNASRVRALLLFDPSGKNPSLWEQAFKNYSCSLNLLSLLLTSVVKF